MRALILEADPEMTEEWKWDVPVWSHGGIVCTGEAYATIVKLTFARGAAIRTRPVSSTPAWVKASVARNLSRRKGTAPRAPETARWTP